MANWIECITSFCDVVETGSFTQAAKKQDHTTSIISKRINQLESMLAIKLLERTTRQVRPTELGQVFYQRVKPLLTEWDNIKQSLTGRKDKLSGRLHIAGTSWLAEQMLSDCVYGYMVKNPEVTIKLSSLHRAVHLVEDQIDICFCGERYVQDITNVQKILICETNKKLFSSKKYLEKYGQPENLKDLEKHKLITIGAYSQNSETWELNGEKILAKGSLHVNHLGCAIDALTEGLGIAYLAYPNSLKSKGDLVQILPDYQSSRYKFFLYYMHQPYITQLMEDFIDYLADRLIKISDFF